MSHTRVYTMLKWFGHSPAKSAEIILDAKRKEGHAIGWIKSAHACWQTRTFPKKSEQPALWRASP